MSPEKIFLSVVIPAYNEETNIGSTLAEVSKYLEGKGFLYEVIVIDDGSEDGTLEESLKSGEKLTNFRIIDSKPNMGKGYVVKKAMLEAKGRYAMFMDADNSTSIYEFDKFLPYLEQGYDAVIGSRRLKESEITVSEPVMRIFLGHVYILLSKLLLCSNVTDFNCGFKVYKQESARRVFSLQRMKDWSFDTELIFLLNKLHMKIKEVPVKWAHKDTSKVKPLKAGVESFLSLIRIKINDIRGLYE